MFNRFVCLCNVFQREPFGNVKARPTRLERLIQSMRFNVLYILVPAKCSNKELVSRPETSSELWLDRFLRHPTPQ
jgi:hypothetical protein